MIDLNQQLDQWLDDGIITTEQADLMRQSVDSSPPPPIVEAAEKHRIPIVTEILGYVGTVLALWAVMFLVSEFWRNLSDWAQISLFAVVAIVLLAAGTAVLDTTEAAIRRLSSVLWAGSVISLSGSTFIAFDSLASFEPELTWTLVGAIAATIGGFMLRRHPSVAQQVVLFAAVLTTAIALLSFGPEPEMFVFGFVVWAYGLVWMLVVRSGLLQPKGAGMVLGAAAMLTGAQITGAEGDLTTIGVLLGLATAGLLAGLGVMLRERIPIILGGVGIFLFVPQAMFHFFGDAMGGMFGLFASGLLLVGLAIWFSRRKEAL